MKEHVNMALSGLLVLAATVMAGSIVHREFFSSAKNVQSLTPRAPEYLSSWKDLLADGILLGDSAAPVKVIEFADFQCPFCRTFHSQFGELRRHFADRVALVFVHFPLAMHPFAMPAARASECALAQGRFTQFHGLLFEKQDSIGLKTWTSFALAAGVPDTERFQHCVEDTTSLRRIDAGLALARKLKLMGTPTIVVNGWHFYTPPAPSELARTVGALLEGKQPFGMSDRSSK